MPCDLYRSKKREYAREHTHREIERETHWTYNSNTIPLEQDDEKWFSSLFSHNRIIFWFKSMNMPLSNWFRRGALPFWMWIIRIREHPTRTRQRVNEHDGKFEMYTRTQCNSCTAHIHINAVGHIIIIIRVKSDEIASNKNVKIHRFSRNKNSNEQQQQQPYYSRGNGCKGNGDSNDDDNEKKETSNIQSSWIELLSLHWKNARTML